LALGLNEMIVAPNFLQNLIELFGNNLPANNIWIYVVIFLVVMIEGPFATLLASSAATTGVLSPLLVYVAASLGNLVADFLWYLLGYHGRLDLLLRWRFLKISPASVDLLKGKIQRHVVKILLISKLTNGMIVPALISTGVAKVPLKKWFPTIFFANLLVTGGFVLVGYFTAINIMKLDHWIRYLALGFSFLFVVLIGLYIQKLIRKQISVEMITDNMSNGFEN
jgi:membrane protein DedA with SNARE-associated domain